jgi:hypothetical protein
MLIVVPPGVWHGVQNVGAVSALLLNLPITPTRTRRRTTGGCPDNDQIPYSFTKAGGPQHGDPGQF